MALPIPTMQLENGDVTKTLCRNLLMALGNDHEFNFLEQNGFLVMLRDHLNENSSDFQIGVVLREGLVPRLVGALDMMQAYPEEMQVPSFKIITKFPFKPFSPSI